MMMMVSQKNNYWEFLDCARLCEDPPAEHLESAPEPPALKRCVYGKARASTINK